MKAARVRCRPLWGGIDALLHMCWEVELPLRQCNARSRVAGSFPWASSCKILSVSDQYMQVEQWSANFACNQGTASCQRAVQGLNILHISGKIPSPPEMTTKAKPRMPWVRRAEQWTL